MNFEDAKAKLVEIITATLTAAGKEVPPMDDGVVLLDGTVPLDSLELAVVVIHMGQFTGKDPFASGFIQFQTLGELARLYTT